MGNLCELNTIDGTATVIGNIYGSKMQVTCLYSVPDFYDAPEFPLTDMHLSLDTSYMVPGQTAQLSAYMEPANAERGVTWATSNPNIVRVDNCGKMTAVATGTALVTAQSIDGSKIKTCTVNVVSSTDGLTLDDAVNGTGSNYTYNNAANYPFETEIRDGRLCAASTMTVQGEALLQVDLGTLTAGSVVRFDWKTDTRYMFHGWILWFNNDYVANLTGSTGWLTYEYVIPVTGQYVITWNLHKDNSPVDGSNMSWVDNLVVESQSTSPVEGVNVTPETAEMYTGGQLALNAEVYPSNVADASVSWSSSNESVATVNADGVVTAVAPGTADIIAATTEGGFTDSCSLTVVDSAVIDAPISDALNVSSGSLVFSNDTAHPWAVDSETFAGRTAANQLSTAWRELQQASGSMPEHFMQATGSVLTGWQAARAALGTMRHSLSTEMLKQRRAAPTTIGQTSSIRYPRTVNTSLNGHIKRTAHAIRAMTAFMLTRCAFFRLSAFWAMLTETEPLQYPMLS